VTPDPPPVGLYICLELKLVALIEMAGVWECKGIERNVKSDRRLAAHICVRSAATVRSGGQPFGQAL